MRARLEVILLLDDESRKQIQVDLTELSMSGVVIINSFDELASMGNIKIKKFIILSKFPMQEGAINELKLYKSIYKFHYIYISADKEYLNYMSTLADCYAMDIRSLNYEKISAIIFNDITIIEKYQVNDTKLTVESRRLAENLLNNSNEEVKKLAKTSLALQSANDYLCSTLDTVKKISEKNERKYLSQKEISKTLVYSYANLLKSAQRSNLSLEQYEMILTKDVYKKVSLLDYDRPPTVLYLKEYQELLHLDSFLWTLYTSIGKQMQKSVKVLKLFDSANSKRVMMESDKYFKLRNGFTASEVLCNDLLVKYGDYTQVLDLLFKNSIDLDILIIVDCKNHNDIVISGNYTLFNMCRNVKKLDVFKLSPNNTIVNNSAKSDLSWNTYRELPKMKNQNDKLIYLSAKPVIQKILKLLRIGLEGF